MRVRIPTPLRSYTAQAPAVEADGATVDELLHHLDAQVLAQQLHHRAPRDPLEDVLRDGRRDHHPPTHDEQVLARALAHVAVVVQHQRLVEAGQLGVGLRERRVHVAGHMTGIMQETGEAVLHDLRQSPHIRGDHRHFGKRENVYTFASPEKLIANFQQDIARWNNENSNS